MTGDEAEMILAADPLRLTEGKDALVDFGTDSFRRWRVETSGAVRSLLGFDERDGALLEVAHELRRDT